MQSQENLSFIVDSKDCPKQTNEKPPRNTKKIVLVVVVSALIIGFSVGSYFLGVGKLFKGFIGEEIVSINDYVSGIGDIYVNSTYELQATKPFTVWIDDLSYGEISVRDTGTDVLPPTGDADVAPPTGDADVLPPTDDADVAPPTGDADSLPPEDPQPDEPDEPIINLDEDLIIHYTFDDGLVPDAYGTPEVTDTSGHKYNGRVWGLPTFVPEFMNGALSFDGIDDCIKINTIPEATGNVFTVSLWAKKRGLLSFVFETFTNSVTKYSIRSYSSAPDNVKILYFKDDVKSPGWKAVDSNSNFNKNEWHHLVLRINVDTVDLFVDGLLTKSEKSIPMVTEGGKMFIGMGRINSTYFFDGVIDDFRFYNKAISDEKVLELYRRGESYKVFEDAKNDNNDGENFAGELFAANAFNSSIDNLSAPPDSAVTVNAGKTVAIHTFDIAAQNVLHIRADNVQWDFDILPAVQTDVEDNDVTEDEVIIDDEADVTDDVADVVVTDDTADVVADVVSDVVSDVDVDVDSDSAVVTDDAADVEDNVESGDILIEESVISPPDDQSLAPASDIPIDSGVSGGGGGGGGILHTSKKVTVINNPEEEVNVEKDSDKIVRGDVSKNKCAGYLDVSENSKYCEAMKWAKENAIFVGYPDGTFRPYDNINRAEILKVAIENLHIDLEAYDGIDNAGFTDLDVKEWYMPYFKTGKNLNIVAGDLGKSTVRPSDPVNRVEAVKFAIEALNISNGSGFKTCDNLSYKDVPPDAWFYKYVCAATEYSLFDLPDTSLFEPSILSTRGEVVLMLYRLSQAF